MNENEIEVNTMAIKLLKDNQLPISERELSILFSEFLYKWVKVASTESLLKYLVHLHRLYYPEIDDIDELKCGDWKNESNYFTSCKSCSDFIMAVYLNVKDIPKLKHFKIDGIEILKNYEGMIRLDNNSN